MSRPPKAPINERSKLPIDHPDYLYPHSRNPYYEKISAFKKLAYKDAETETLRGRWREDGFLVPQTGRPLHVEIGCNAGHVTVAWAKNQPNEAFIGLDYKIKAATRAAEKLADLKIQNALFLRATAARIGYIFGPQEIDHLYLFFPDPWPQKSLFKNRFLCEKNLRMLHPLLKKGGTFWIKTDHDAYFDWMIEHIEKTTDLWESTALTRDLHAGVQDPTKLEIPEVTLFEKLFIRDKIKIKSVILKPR